MRTITLINHILKNLHLWGLYHVLEEIVPQNDCSFCKKYHCESETKPLLEQLVPIAPCLLHVTPFENRASIPFVAAL